MEEIFWILDRLEGGEARLEGPDGAFRTAPRALLPGDAREGDVLRERGRGYVRDDAATAARKAAVRDKLRRVFRK